MSDAESQSSIAAYINSERSRGLPDIAIRDALLAKGWKAEDIDTILTGQAPQKVGSNFASLGKRARLYIKCAFGLPIIGLTASVILGFYDDDLMMLWFVAAGLGVLFVIATIGWGILCVVRKRPAAVYLKFGVMMLILFFLVGFGTCYINMENVNF